MFTYHLPQSEVLKKHIDYFYELSTRQNFPLRYTAFPTTGTCLSFFRNAIITIDGSDVVISQSTKPQPAVILLGRILAPVNIYFRGYVEEVSIVFNAAGINHFFDKPYSVIAPDLHNVIIDKKWQDVSGELFSRSGADRLFYLEKFLLSQLVADNKKYLATISDLFLNDEEIRVRTLAEKVYMSERNFLRYFKAGFGCSPSEFRKIIRFRKAVSTKEGRSLLNDICFQNSYYDPSHFRKDFRKLTFSSPSVFFKTISRIGPGNYPFKVHH